MKNTKNLKPSHGNRLCFNIKIKENKNDLENLVEDYGYFDEFPDGALAGRASQIVEYMAVLPKRGKKQELIDAAASVGVLLQTTRKKFPDGKTHECLTFPTAYQQKLKQQIRDVVKNREK